MTPVNSTRKHADLESLSRDHYIRLHSQAVEIQRREHEYSLRASRVI